MPPLIWPMADKARIAATWRGAVSNTTSRGGASRREYPDPTCGRLNDDRGTGGKLRSCDGQCLFTLLNAPGGVAQRRVDVGRFQIGKSLKTANGYRIGFA